MTFYTHNFDTHTIYQIPVFTDNYVYVIAKESSAWVIDPGDPDSTQSLLESQTLTLQGILNTHHHWDHVDGNLKLKETWHCPIFSSEYDKNRIPGQTNSLNDQDTFEVLGTSVTSHMTPGHTLGHMIYHFSELNIAFVGDTLFSLGCGRLFEGSPEQMFQSLEKIKTLPKDTHIFCTHEYTADNLRFHKSTIPDDTKLQPRENLITKLLSSNTPTVPFALHTEIEANGFLRSDDPYIQKKMGTEGAPPWQTFAELRKRKDNF